MHKRGFSSALLAGSLVVAFPSMGRALGEAAARSPVARYTEAHEAGDDVRIRVDAAGRAHVEHTLTWKVLAGQKHTLELVGVEPTAIPEAQATVMAEDDHALSAQVSVAPPKRGQGTAASPSFVITLDDPKALRRGTYRVRVAYDVDLVAEHEIVRDGSMWRIAWMGPIAPEGYDGARVVFDLPGAATEPRVVRPDADTPDESVLSSLRRQTDRDELELVRPHVARGEAAVWSALLSPRALSGQKLVADATPRQTPAPPRGPRASWPLGLLLVVAVLYGLAVRRKERMFRRASREAGADVRPVVPMPSWARPLVAGAALGLGAALQVGGQLEVGSLLIAAAMICAVIAAAQREAAPRGPGRWLALRPKEAFAAKDRLRGLDPLDAGMPVGSLVLSIVCAALAGVAFLARRSALVSPYLLVLDGLALVIPLFLTGRQVELPLTLAGAGRMLRPVFARLSRNDSLRVAPWARVPTGAEHPDELRLLVLPRLAMPGLIGIEVGVATGRATAHRRYATRPEVLVRVHEASAAAARIATLTPRLTPVTGRRPEERVYRFAPRYPTSGWTRALVERLGRELFDRREEVLEWSGNERRAPARMRLAPGAQAA